MSVVSQKIRDSAQGQDCTLRSIYCCFDPETTVLAHLRTKDAAGIGQKPDDFHAVFACHRCHLAMDEHRLGPHKDRYILDALQKTQRIWYAMGLLKIPETTKKPKKLTKVMPRVSLWKTGAPEDYE